MQEQPTLAEAPNPGATRSRDTAATAAAAAATATPPTKRATGNAALLCVLSMSSVQFGAALSAPTMNAFGSFSTTWLRLCWAAAVLGRVVRPKGRTYSRAHWVAAGPLGRPLACTTL